MWEDVFEAARQPFTIHADIHAVASIDTERVDLSDLSRRGVGPDAPLFTMLDNALSAYASTFISSAARRQLQIAERLRERADQLPPWLTSTTGAHQLVAFDPLPLRRRITGFEDAIRLPGPIFGASGMLGSDFPDSMLTVGFGDILLERGSISARSKAIIWGTLAGALTVFGGLAGADIYNDLKSSLRFEAIVDGQPCKAELGAKLHVKDLDSLSDRLLNYEEKGISPEERKLRVCQVQTLLAAHHLSPGAIDGAVGPQTRGALDVFKKTHHLSGKTLRSPALRARLLDVPPPDEGLHEMLF